MSVSSLDTAIFCEFNHDISTKSEMFDHRTKIVDKLCFAGTLRDNHISYEFPKNESLASIDHILENFLNGKTENKIRQNSTLSQVSLDIAPKAKCTHIKFSKKKFITFCNLEKNQISSEETVDICKKEYQSAKEKRGYVKLFKSKRQNMIKTENTTKTSITSKKSKIISFLQYFMKGKSRTVVYSIAEKEPIPKTKSNLYYTSNIWNATSEDIFSGNGTLSEYYYLSSNSSVSSSFALFSNDNTDTCSFTTNSLMSEELIFHRLEKAKKFKKLCYDTTERVWEKTGNMPTINL